MLDLLAQVCTEVDTSDASQEIIVYDQCTTDPDLLSADCFMMVLLRKLNAVFNHVSLLKGAFLLHIIRHCWLGDVGVICTAERQKGTK